MDFLSPSKKVHGKSGGIGILVSGTDLRFNKETVLELGLKDHVNFGIEKEVPGKEGRLYITKDQETDKFTLLGGVAQKGGKYINDPKIAKEAKLTNGEFYWLKKDEIGRYITYNPNAEWKAPKDQKASNKETAEKIKQKRLDENGDPVKKKKIEAV